LPAISAARPSTSVTIDKPRELRFTWSAVNRFEEHYGKAIGEALQQNVGARLITHLAWAAQLHRTPGLTIVEVERQLDSFLNQEGDIDDLATKIMSVLIESGVIGKAKAETKKPEEGAEGEAPAVPAEIIPEQ